MPFQQMKTSTHVFRPLMWGSHAQGPRCVNGITGCLGTRDPIAPSSYHHEMGHGVKFQFFFFFRCFNPKKKPIQRAISLFFVCCRFFCCNKSAFRRAPLRVVFPEFDPLAWSRADRSSAGDATSIDTHVSQEGSKGVSPSYSGQIITTFPAGKGHLKFVVKSKGIPPRNRPLNSGLGHILICPELSDGTGLVHGKELR